MPEVRDRVRRVASPTSRRRGRTAGSFSNSAWTSASSSGKTKPQPVAALLELRRPGERAGAACGRSRSSRRSSRRARRTLMPGSKPAIAGFVEVPGERVVDRVVRRRRPDLPALRVQQERAERVVVDLERGVDPVEQRRASPASRAPRPRPGRGTCRSTETAGRALVVVVPVLRVVAVRVDAVADLVVPLPLLSRRFLRHRRVGVERVLVAVRVRDRDEPQLVVLSRFVIAVSFARQLVDVPVEQPPVDLGRDPLAGVLRRRCTAPPGVIRRASSRAPWVTLSAMISRPWTVWPITSSLTSCGLRLRDVRVAWPRCRRRRRSRARRCSRSLSGPPRPHARSSPLLFLRSVTFHAVRLQRAHLLLSLAPGRPAGPPVGAVVGGHDVQPRDRADRGYFACETVVLYWSSESPPPAAAAVLANTSNPTAMQAAATGRSICPSSVSGDPSSGSRSGRLHPRSAARPRRHARRSGALSALSEGATRGRRACSACVSAPPSSDGFSPQHPCRRCSRGDERRSGRAPQCVGLGVAAACLSLGAHAVRTPPMRTNGKSRSPGNHIYRGTGSTNGPRSGLS